MGEGFTPTCMSAAELAAWREMAVRVRGGGVRPCADCPRAFALEMGSCCNGRPESKGGRLKGDGHGRYFGALTEAQLTAAYSIGTDQ